MTTVFTYKSCDTCRKAKKWLTANEIEFTEIPIREQPPSQTQLRTMLGHLDGELKRLFNTSGQDYRALNMKERLPEMSEDEAIALLAENGNLVKRPFLLTDDSGTVGFREDAWAELFR